MRRLYVSLAEAYAFGEEIMDVKFKNAILDSMMATAMKWNTFPGLDAVNLIYEGTTSKSPARHLLVDIHAQKAHAGKEWNVQYGGCPKEFLVDLVSAMAGQRPASGKEPWKYAWESYHEKEVGEVTA